MAGISRESYQLVSKVYPHNAGKPNIFRSCEASLKRLRTDHLDIYLLHWRGSVPLDETIDCMQELARQGKIRRYGVSNLDTADMEELLSIPGGKLCAVNQVLYHIGSRGIEYDLMPYTQKNNIAIMAYCPLAQAGTLRRMRPAILNNQTLLKISQQYNITVMQLMLAFTLRHPNVMAIPKASTTVHVNENAAVLGVAVSPEDWQAVDQVFIPPTCKTHLDIE